MDERTGSLLGYPASLIGRHTEWRSLAEFVASGVPGPSLGLVWGRRRVGKSLLLESLADAVGGFYYAAVRGSDHEALRDLGVRLGAYRGAGAALALDSWEGAVTALLDLAQERETLVVLDEFPYLLEHTPNLDAILQRVLGVWRADRERARARLILCGSAIAVMRDLLGGSAPLRGRAGLDLHVAAFDLRTARALHGIDDLRTAFQTYAVIGGVAAYAREMVGNDLPKGPDDFPRWLTERVLSPAAPLFREIPLLLSEDPTLSKARKVNLYHATLAGVASGHHAHHALTSYVKTSGSALLPIVEALVAARFIERVEDPIRENRPTYYPADPLLRFHYAVIRGNQRRLERPERDAGRIWESLRETFRAQVLGPCFEAVAREWTQTTARDETVGGPPAHVGPTTLILPDGDEMQLDVVVAADDSATPGARTILAIGEAKAGNAISLRTVERLTAARAALGPRAARARLLCFGASFSPEVIAAAAARPDIELVDLERLYVGE